MKNGVLCMFEGERRLWKDDTSIVFDAVPMKLSDEKSNERDLDVQTIGRVEAAHEALEGKEMLPSAITSRKHPAYAESFAQQDSSPLARFQEDAAFSLMSLLGNDKIIDNTIDSTMNNIAIPYYSNAGQQQDASLGGNHYYYLNSNGKGLSGRDITN
jgi:hypothetical protein